VRDPDPAGLTHAKAISSRRGPRYRRLSSPRASPDQVFAPHGLAIAETSDGPHLYATDFHNGRVDVFNGSFGLVTRPGAFVDPSLPNDYAPFGVQTIGARIFVTLRQAAVRQR
jgi:hypothetical protein